MTKYPTGEIPVQLNDVIFSLHAILASSITLIQCLIYDVRFTTFILILYSLKEWRSYSYRISSERIPNGLNCREDAFDVHLHVPICYAGGSIEQSRRNMVSLPYGLLLRQNLHHLG